MRIALDASYTIGSHLTGIGIYSQEVLTGLAQGYPSDRFTFCYRPKPFLQSNKPSHPNARRWILYPPLNVPSDVFHALNQRVDYRPCRRVVTTFHDLFVMTAEYSTPEFRARFTEQARQAASQSDLIVAVSQFTAQQVEDLLHIPSSRIRVVHHGVHLPEPGESPQPREKLVLFVGALQTRKNISRLVEAFEQIGNEWQLLLAGPSNGYGADEIQQRLQASPCRDRIRVLGHQPAQELTRLYCTASIFAFPSLDEGFGIPVLEAMAHGLPVLTSNCSALPEVAGDAALQVNPYKVDKIAEGLDMLMRDEHLRADLAVKGRERAQQFSWSRTVHALRKIYADLAG